MNNYLVFLVAISVLILVSCASSQDKDLPQLKTVKYVDLNKYVGLWYEIAKIPNSFQDQCVYGTTAVYRIDEDGDIIVTNSCYDEDDKLDTAEGLAIVVDKNTSAKLIHNFIQSMFKDFLAINS